MKIDIKQNISYPGIWKEKYQKLFNFTTYNRYNNDLFGTQRCKNHETATSVEESVRDTQG